MGESGQSPTQSEASKEIEKTLSAFTPIQVYICLHLYRYRYRQELVEWLHVGNEKCDVIPEQYSASESRTLF